MMRSVDADAPRCPPRYRHTRICHVMTNADYPRFDGAIGQLARSRAFLEFICRNVGPGREAVWPSKRTTYLFIRNVKP